MIPDFETLVRRFNESLPGEEAHRIMYPRAAISPNSLKPDENTRLSAVAILLYNGPDYLHSLVIQRSVYEGTHSGQIAFPGGKWESADVTGLNTALRECHEEIGVGADELQYIGKLTDVYTAVSSFLIEPHVFFWNRPRTDLQVAEREVAAVHSIPLKPLLDEKTIVYRDVLIKNGLVLKQVPHFDIYPVQIWGATALMLSELKMVLRSIE
jgi:8-oxo-dGTP pyrophosphatase MutT (NUDIX family)